MPYSNRISDTYGSAMVSLHNIYNKFDQGIPESSALFYPKH